MIVPVREGRAETGGAWRFARAVRAAAREAEATGLTEDEIGRLTEGIREEIHQEHWHA
jgi:hypothetical protein